MTPKTDDQLMKEVAMGDQRAFEALFKRYGSRVLGYARRILSDQGLAEEVSQEVWIKIVRSATNYDSKNQFTSWLLTIVRNTAISEMRKRSRYSRDVELDEQIVGSVSDSREEKRNLESALIARYDLSMVRNRIDSLPDFQRTVIVIWMTEELSYEEIASQTGATVSAVKSALFRAKKSLETSLKEVS